MACWGTDQTSGCFIQCVDWVDPICPRLHPRSRHRPFGRPRLLPHTIQRWNRLRGDSHLPHRSMHQVLAVPFVPGYLSWSESFPRTFPQTHSNRIALQLGAGICFGATLPVVGHWFSKRRGLALGLTALGSSCGGTVYPIAARQLITRVGCVHPSVSEGTAVLNVYS